jgi:hypothetical protein
MAQALTIISGVVLLGIFVLVALTVRRGGGHITGDSAEQKD